ncbi:hypothetical protein VPH35_041057 [Triticum aestivum]|uniref:Uncharacterized protein n=1 Tax=Aegilops tauschii TaxID=37682 RepID=N1R5R7_AEGTA
MLIDLDTPVPIAWLLNRSPRQRIQKLIGSLAWRSLAEKEMRWVAARIVEHLAGDLNLAHFLGALECIPSLFETSCHNTGDQEALHLSYVINHSRQRKRTGSPNQNLAGNQQQDKEGNLNFAGGMSLLQTVIEGSLKKIDDQRNDDALQQDIKQRGNCEDLVLTGLRILENLSHDGNNCTLIYNTKDLLSKILTPVSSNKLVEDIKSNVAWTKVADGSLKVVRTLMCSSGSTGIKMRILIANNINAIKSLEAILYMDMESNNGSIIKLQMRAIEILTQLALHHPASISPTKRRDKFIERALHIFLTTDWMEDYLKDEKSNINKLTSSQQNNLVNKVSGARKKEKMDKQATEALAEKQMKEAKGTASRLKERAGEALAMLSSDSEAMKSFTGWDDNLHHLTGLLNSKIKTIECKISATEKVEIDINISCRISAAVILKHLSNYVDEPTFRKILAKLFTIQAGASSTSTPQGREHAITSIGNDIENPSNGGQGEPSALQCNLIQQCASRLQAELLSLVASIRARSNLDFAAIVMPQMSSTALEDSVVRLKKMVEDNMYATPACLAIQKLTCEMVIELIQQEQNVEAINRHNIVDTLLEAYETMAGLESIMLFDGVDRDCHGVPLKPLSSVLAKNAEYLLAHTPSVPIYSSWF